MCMYIYGMMDKLDFSKQGNQQHGVVTSQAVESDTVSATFTCSILIWFL